MADALLDRYGFGNQLTDAFAPERIIEGIRTQVYSSLTHGLIKDKIAKEKEENQ